MLSCKSGTSSTRLTAVYGKQNVYTLRNFYNTASYASDYLLASGGTTLTAISKLFYRETSVTTTFTNQDISTCYINIYQVEPRFHLPLQIRYTILSDQLWYTGLNDESQTTTFDTQMCTKGHLHLNYFVFTGK